jgi:hypothetical protein
MKKGRPLNLQISYGIHGTRIRLNLFTATEYILVKDYNEDVMLRVYQEKPREVDISISKREYDIMIKEMSTKTKFIMDRKLNFYLWAEGIHIATFSYTMTTEEIAEEAKERFDDTLKKLGD